MLQNKEILNKVIEPLTLRKMGISIIKMLRYNGYRLIRVKEYRGSSNTLQFMIEHNNMENVQISDCVKISKVLTKLLDNSSIESNFNIEVKSPGIERPLIEYSDFIRFKGSKIRVALNNEIKAQNCYVGELINCENGEIELINEKTQSNIILNFKNIKDANLVFEF